MSSILHPTNYHTEIIMHHLYSYSDPVRGAWLGLNDGQCDDERAMRVAGALNTSSPKYQYGRAPAPVGIYPAKFYLDGCVRKFQQI